MLQLPSLITDEMVEKALATFTSLSEGASERPKPIARVAMYQAMHCALEVFEGEIVLKLAAQAARSWSPLLNFEPEPDFEPDDGLSP